MADSITGFDIYSKTTAFTTAPGTVDPQGTFVASVGGTVTTFTHPIPNSTLFYRLIGHTAAGLIIPYNDIQPPPITGTPGQLQWARQLSSAHWCEVFSVMADSLGNIYMGGDYQNSISNGINSYPGVGSFDGFLAKYTSDGTPVWLRTFAADGDDVVKAVAIDSSGNVCITGSFTGTIDFGGVILSSPADPLGKHWPQIFVAKYTPANTLLWVKQFGSLYSDSAMDMAIDSADNLYVGGQVSTNASATFGTITVPPNGISANALFITKVSPAGDPIWVKTFGISAQVNGTSNTQFRGIQVDRATGDVYAAGEWNGVMDYGNGPQSGSGASSLFLAKYRSADGAFIWGRTIGEFSLASTSGGHCGIAVSNGIVYLFAACTGNTDFGTGPVSGGYALSAYTILGVPLWSVAWGSTSSYDHGYSVAVSNGKIVVCGQAFSGAFDFGGGWQIGNGNPDLFVGGFTLNPVPSLPPTYSWSYRAGTGMDGISSADWVTIDGFGKVIIGGILQRSVNFGGATITAGPAQSWGYIAKFNL